MSLINNYIPSQNFELIREQIATILREELANQAIEDYDNTLNADILVEKSDPIDKTGLPTINVCFASATYDNKNYSGCKRANPYTYNIDVYASGMTDDVNDGDYNSNVLLQKLVGKIGYILDHPVYKTLGFANPLIERVWVSDVNISNKISQDALNVVWGRITFNVIVVETTQPTTPVYTDAYVTQVFLDKTSQGYLYKSI